MVVVQMGCWAREWCVKIRRDGAAVYLLSLALLSPMTCSPGREQANGAGRNPNGTFCGKERKVIQVSAECTVCTAHYGARTLSQLANPGLASGASFGLDRLCTFDWRLLFRIAVKWSSGGRIINQGVIPDTEQTRKPWSGLRPQEGFRTRGIFPAWWCMPWIVPSIHLKPCHRDMTLLN